MKIIKYLNYFIFILGISLLLIGTYLNYYESSTKNEISNKKITLQNSLQVTFSPNDKLEISSKNSSSQLIFSIKNVTNRTLKYKIKFASIDEQNISSIKINLLKNGKKEIDNKLLSDVVNENNEFFETVIAPDDIEKYQIVISETSDNEKEISSFTSQIIIELLSLESNSSIDGIAPTIELNGEAVVSIDQNETFIDSGIEKIIDDVDGLIPVNYAKVTYYYSSDDNKEKEQVSNIDTSKKGIYYIYYEINDSAGNTSIAIRVVYVKEKNKENTSENSTPTMSPVVTITPTENISTATPNQNEYIQEQIQQKGDILKKTFTSYLKELYDTTTIYDEDWKNENQEATISLTLEEIKAKFSFDLSMFYTEEVQCDYKSTYGTVHFYKDGTKQYDITLQCLYKFGNNYYNIK